MKKLLKIISVAVIFTVLTAVFLPSAVSVSADSDYSKNYTDYSGTYQGEKNWYYYSGNYENDSLIRMYYCSSGSYWQGQSYYNRIDVTLTQTPAGGYDAIRAYVVPRTCRISLSGNLMNYCGAGSNGAVAKIALRRVGNTDSGNDVVLFDETLLYSDENVNLSNVPSLQNIDVNAGDVLFFVVSDNGEDGNDFLCFEVVPVLTDIAAESAFSTAVAAESVDVRSGNFSIAIEGGILRPHDLFIPHMNPSDEYAYTEMVYGFTDTQANPSMGQSAGFVKMARDLTQAHKPYHIPNYTVEATAVQVAWGNQFFSNPYAGFAGLKFNVPSDGKMSVLGGATTTNDGISYIVCLIRSGVYTIVSQKDVAQSVITYFDEDEDINDFSVQAGDQVVYVACSATPHVSQSADIIFDYEAAAGTDYMVEETEKVISSAHFNSTVGYRQGYNNWYYLNGKADGNYYKMAFNGRDAWNGVDSLCTIAIGYVHPANEYDAIKMWRAPADGTATIYASVQVSNLSLNGVGFTIYKKTYSPTLGEATIFGEGRVVVSAGEDKRVYKYENVDIRRGDMYFFVIDANGGVDYDSTTLETYVDFTQTAPGTPVDENIGDVRIADTSETYSDEQGKYGWFYASGTPEKYTMMDYSMGINNLYMRWNSRQEDCCVTPYLQHPGRTLGSMRIYVCDSAGKLDIIGIAQKLSSGGDGLVAGIYLNTTELMKKTFAYDELTPYVLTDTLNGIEVQAGDRIVFYLGNEKGNSHAYDAFSFYTQIVWTERSGDTLAESELSGYLTPVSYPELLGVNEVQGFTGEDGKANNLADTVLYILSGICVICGILLLTLKRGLKR